MAFLSTKIHRFTIVIGPNIFPLLVPTFVPMSSYGTCPISLLSVGLSLRFFTEDKSYQYLQDATLFALLSDKIAK